MLLALHTALEQSYLHLSLYQPGPVTLAKFVWIWDHLLVWGQATKLQTLWVLHTYSPAKDSYGLVGLGCAGYQLSVWAEEVSASISRVSLTEDSNIIWDGDTIRIGYWLACQEVLLMEECYYLSFPLCHLFLNVDKVFDCCRICLSILSWCNNSLFLSFCLS